MDYDHTKPAPKPAFPDLADSETEKEDIFDKLGHKLGPYFWVALVGGILWWVAFSCFYAPSTKEDDRASLTRSAGAMNRVVVVLTESFHTYPRLELMKAQNLDIYLGRDEFQSVPYPDRSESVARVGRVWCKQVEHTFLPAVRFRDIATGSTLASYGCLMKQASLSD